MAIGYSSLTTPLSNLGDGLGLKTSAGLVLGTTLGGGLADCCLRHVRRKMDGLLQVLVG